MALTFLSASTAVELICEYGFEHRRLQKVYVMAVQSNPASARVLEKAGFTKKGELRKEAFTDGERVDVHRYGLLATD